MMKSILSTACLLLAFIVQAEEIQIDDNEYYTLFMNHSNGNGRFRVAIKESDPQHAIAITATIAAVALSRGHSHFALTDELEGSIYHIHYWDQQPPADITSIRAADFATLVPSSVRIPSLNAETTASQLYASYIALLENTFIAADTQLTISPDHMTERENHIILQHSYYISPNNLRGFEIALPKSAITTFGHNITLTKHLSVASKSYQQGIHLITMTE